MKISAEFKNGACKLVVTTEDEWEQKLLGAVAKGGDLLSASVSYSAEGHFTHGRGKAVSIVLTADGGIETNT